MKPRLSATCVIIGTTSNGTDRHPAIINRIWGEGSTIDGPVTINVMAFPDCGSPQCFTSVPLFNDKEKAETFLATQSPYRPVVAYWDMWVGEIDHTLGAGKENT